MMLLTTKRNIELVVYISIVLFFLVLGYYGVARETPNSNDNINLICINDNCRDIRGENAGSIIDTIMLTVGNETFMLSTSAVHFNNILSVDYSIIRGKNE